MISQMFNIKMMLKQHNIFVFTCGSVHYLKNALNQLYIARKKTNIVDGSRYHKRLEQYRNDSDVKRFFEYCTVFGISPYNFIRQNSDMKLKYKLVHKYNTSLCDYEIDLDSEYGLSVKYIFEQYFKENKTETLFKQYSSICNVRIKGNSILFTASKNYNLLSNFEYKSELEKESVRYTVTPSIIFKSDDRELFLRFCDYLSIYKTHYPKDYYNHTINKNEIYISGNNSNKVIGDFLWFNEHNKLPCVICGHLVDNAFSGYSIQFNKHDGCR